MSSSGICPLGGGEMEVLHELTSIHSVFLFHSRGWNTLKTMCTLLSGTLPSPFISSWKDLAALLDLSIHQIGCIENGRLDDCTMLVLKTFAQSEDATLDKVVSALVKMKRSDVLSNVWPHLINLKDFVSNNHLLEKANLSAMLEGLRASLPITLSLGEKGLMSPLVTKRELFLENASAPPPKSPLSNNRNKKKKRVRNCSCKVMLTFASDGECVAKEVAKQFRRKRGHILPIGVLLLEEHYQRVVADPEHFITSFFGHVDYVVPILTKGYLDLIGQKKRAFLEEESGCLDAKYVQFIYSLMNTHFIKNSCLNMKVRCLIKEDQLEEIHSHPEMQTKPILVVALPQSQTERLARQILMAKLSINEVPPPNDP